MSDQPTKPAATADAASEPDKKPSGLLQRVDDCPAGRDDIGRLTADGQKRWRIPRTADWLAMDLPPIEYLVGNWCVVGASILVAGPTKCGKTLFMYSLAHAVSVGTPIFGWQTPSGGAPIAIIDGEMRPQSIKGRLESITKHIPGAGELQIVAREFFTDRGEKFPDLSNPKDLNILLDRVSPQDNPVKVIVFDNINALFKGDENQAAYWNQVEDLIVACRARGIAAWLVHHTPKSNPHRPSGSSKAERMPEVTIMLEKVGNSAGKPAHFNVRFLHCRDAAEITTEFSARFDNATGWEVGAYVPQEIPIAGQDDSRREEVCSMLEAGEPWQKIVEQTGFARSSVFRIKKKLGK